jgi:hypothetical protein
MSGIDHPGSDCTAAKLLYCPGNQKLTPPSSAKADIEDTANTPPNTRILRPEAIPGICFSWFRIHASAYEKVPIHR